MLGLLWPSKQALYVCLSIWLYQQCLPEMPVQMSFGQHVNSTYHEPFDDHLLATVVIVVSARPEMRPIRRLVEQCQCQAAACTQLATELDLQMVARDHMLFYPAAYL